jgi:hypothetical protein
MTLSKSIRFFRFELKLKFPSSSANLIEFASLMEDINEAVKHFNARYSGKRLIVPMEVGVHSMAVMLGVNNGPENISGRHLRVFSDFLFNEKGWHRFSSQTNKLFVSDGYTEIESSIAQDILRRIISNPLYSNIKFDIWLPPQSLIETPIKGDIQTLSDDDALIVLEYLIRLKDVGDENTRVKKAKAINEIKRLLLPWV